MALFLMEIPPILIKAYDYLRVEMRHLRDDPELRDFFWRWRKELGVVGALLLILAAPFLLKPETNSVPSKYDRRLVITDGQARISLGLTVEAEEAAEH